MRFAVRVRGSPYGYGAEVVYAFERTGVDFDPTPRIVGELHSRDSGESSLRTALCDNAAVLGFQHDLAATLRFYRRPAGAWLPRLELGLEIPSLSAAACDGSTVVVGAGLPSADSGVYFFSLLEVP